MEKTVQLLMTSYVANDVEITLSKIQRKASSLNIHIDDILTQDETSRLEQPKLWGCDGKDVTKQAILLTGSMDKIKELIQINTPDGVLIEILHVELA